MDEQTEREAAINSLAYDTYMNGFAETTGDVEGPGHFARVIFDEPIVTNFSEPVVGVIFDTDSNGFVNYKWFHTMEDILLDWDQIEEMVNTFYDDEDDDDLDDDDDEDEPEPGGLACEVRQSETWTGTE